MQAVLLLSLGLYVWIGETYGGRVLADVKTVRLVLLGLSVWAGAAFLFFRQRLVRASEEILRLQPEDAAALARWRAGYFGIWCSAEALGMCGFVLRLLGGTLLQALPFYAAAAVLMVVFTPRRPE